MKLHQGNNGPPGLPVLHDSSSVSIGTGTGVGQAVRHRPCDAKAAASWVAMAPGLLAAAKWEPSSHTISSPAIPSPHLNPAFPTACPAPLPRRPILWIPRPWIGLDTWHAPLYVLPPHPLHYHSAYYHSEISLHIEIEQPSIETVLCRSILSSVSSTWRDGCYDELCNVPGGPPGHHRFQQLCGVQQWRTQGEHGGVPPLCPAEPRHPRRWRTRHWQGREGRHLFQNCYVSMHGRWREFYGGLAVTGGRVGLTMFLVFL
jgi:hypothetical protein